MSLSPSSTGIGSFVNHMRFRMAALSFHWGWIGLILSFYLGAEPFKFDIKGESALLMNAESGAILFENQAFTPCFPASTTKVATALYVLKQHGDKLDMQIIAEQDSLATVSHEIKRKSNYTLPAYWLEPDGTHIAIKKGEIFSLHVLLQGMLICSGNDAANVIAHALGPTVPTFMDGLNAYLKEIGCQNTHLCNPHGLHVPQHQSTAYDLALIAREAMKSPVICDIVSQTRFLRPKTNKQPAATLLQGNRLLRTGKFYYSKAIGMKTGYHAKAKNTFIGAARANGRTLIVVLLGYQDRTTLFEEAIKLFETAFNQPKVQRTFLKEGLQVFRLDLPRAEGPIQTYLTEPLSFEYYPAEDPQAKCLLYWKQLSPPLSKDQQVGELQLVSAKGEILRRAPLLALKEVKLAWPYRWLALLPLFHWLFLLSGALVVIVIVVTLWNRKS
jgi:serine-type D-Ala-D-Ala carboxypeptidase (penicillin-binding protein 5/6)